MSRSDSAPAMMGQRDCGNPYCSQCYPDGEGERRFQARQYAGKREAYEMAAAPLWKLKADLFLSFATPTMKFDLSGKYIETTYSWNLKAKALYDKCDEMIVEMKRLYLQQAAV